MKKKFFPDSGVYVTTEFGEVLFHHRAVGHLKDEHWARLAAFGIYKNKNHFSSDEDQIIKKNWRRLSEMYGLDYKEPLFYAGIGARNSKKDHRAALKGIPFWPEICRGLDDRTAVQVRYRMETLLNSIAWNPDTDETLKSKYGVNDFSVDDQEKLAHLYELLSGNVFEISKRMNIPTTRVRRLYYQRIAHAIGNTPIVRGRWLRLWNLVKLHQNMEGKKDGKLVKKLVRDKSLEVEDFEEVAKCMRWNVDFVKLAWKDILEALRDELEGGKSSTEAFEGAVRAHAYRLTYLQRAVFANIYRNCLPPNCFSLHNARKDIDMKTVDLKRKAAGLTDFSVISGNGELWTLLHYTTFMIYRFRKCILDNITLAIDAKGIVKIIVRICARIEQESRKRSTMISVEEMVRLVTEEIKSDWIPPWKFQRHIDDQALRKNLVEDDNSNYRKKKRHHHSDGANFGDEQLYVDPGHLVYSTSERV